MNYIITEIVITMFIVFFICNSIVIFIICFYSFIGFVFTEFMVLFLFCLYKRKPFNEFYCTCCTLLTRRVLSFESGCVV